MEDMGSGIDVDMGAGSPMNESVAEDSVGVNKSMEDEGVTDTAQSNSRSEAPVLEPSVQTASKGVGKARSPLPLPQQKRSKKSRGSEKSSASDVTAVAQVGAEASGAVQEEFPVDRAIGGS